jgi:hypothetical protein
VAAALGLPGNPPDAAANSRNKLATRRALRAAGLPTPAFDAVSVGANPSDVAVGRPYPVVIKPLALSGSRGVMRVDTESDFVPAFLRLRHLLQSIDIRAERDGAHHQVLIESFVPGREYAVEAVLTGGVLQVFAIFDKPDPLDGPFFEETIYVTPSRATDPTQQAIVQAIGDAARALGLRHGPIHAECRISDRGVYVLEVAPRPIGGLCSKAVRFQFGEGESVRLRQGYGGQASLEELLLRHAIGHDVRGYTRETGASGVMMIPIPAPGVFRGVSGVEDACAIPGVREVHITAKTDETLVPLPEGRSYLGFIFARASTPGTVERALRSAHERLVFSIDRALTIVGS